jgi:hypothetical protein
MRLDTGQKVYALNDEVATLWVPETRFGVIGRQLCTRG